LEAVEAEQSPFFRESFEQIIQNSEEGQLGHADMLCARIKSSLDEAGPEDELKTENVSLVTLVSTLDNFIAPEKIKQILSYKNSHGATLLYFIRRQKMDLSKYETVEALAKQRDQEIFYQIMNPPYPRPNLSVQEGLRLGLDPNAHDQNGMTVFGYAFMGVLMYRDWIDHPERINPLDEITKEDLPRLSVSFINLMFRLIKMGAKINTNIITKEGAVYSPLNFALRCRPADLGVVTFLKNHGARCNEGDRQLAEAIASEPVKVFLRNPWEKPRGEESGHTSDMTSDHSDFEKIQYH
jgi:hypothetical protein